MVGWLLALNVLTFLVRFVNGLIWRVLYLRVLDRLHETQKMADGNRHVGAVLSDSLFENLDQFVRHELLLWSATMAMLILRWFLNRRLNRSAASLFCDKRRRYACDLRIHFSDASLIWFLLGKFGDEGVGDENRS